MKIDFFETKNGMDQRAVKGGVYQVELLMDEKEPICLYVGESVWIATRCGQHIYSLYEDPAYFGLTEQDLVNERLTIRFSVLETIEKKKSVLGIGKYKERELKAIKENKPITQLETSDKQIRDINYKICKVQDVLKKNGYKKDE